MKTKKILLFALMIILVFSLTAADTVSIRLHINNKSGYEAYVSLDGLDFEKAYRFTIPLGSRADIETLSYDVIKGDYTVTVNYYKAAEEGLPKIWISRQIKTMDFSKQNSKLNLLPPVVMDFCEGGLKDPRCEEYFMTGVDGMFFKFNPDGFWFQKHYPD